MYQKKEGRRGLVSIEDSVDISTQRREDYIEKHGERLITVTRNNTDNSWNNRMTITKKQKWEEKQLCGRFKWLISNISRKKTWKWLRKGNLKRETESLRIKARIDKLQQNNKCWLCDDWNETINHIISECCKSALE